MPESRLATPTASHVDEHRTVSTLLQGLSACSGSCSPLQDSYPSGGIAQKVEDWLKKSQSGVLTIIEGSAGLSEHSSPSKADIGEIMEDGREGVPE